MYVTVTERGTFKRCERQWGYSSKNGEHLTPLVVSPALNIGTLVHEAGEQWLLDPASSYAEHVMTSAARRETVIREAYKKQIGVGISDIEMGPFYEGVLLAKQMGDNYQVRWGTPLPEHYELVQPEQKIQIPIPNSEHECERCLGTGWTGRSVGVGESCPECGGDGRAYHFLEGKLDGLVRSRVDGSIWVFERKTYGNRPKPEALQYSDQFLAYMWMLTQLKVANVGGILYDGLWKRDHVPRGRTFEDLFLRLSITRSRAELDEFETLLLVEVTKMAAARTRPLTINRQWMGCWDCAFQKICYAQSRGEDVETIKRRFYTQRTDDLDEELDDVTND